MKKFFSLMVIAAMSVTMVGCGDKKTEKKVEEKTEVKTETKTEAPPK